MNNEILIGVFRHLLTIFGGYLVSSGKLDPSSADTIVGAVTALAGVGLSIKHKLK
jgi:flagellar motor component MotA